MKFLSGLSLFAAAVGAQSLPDYFKAYWIDVPDASQQDYGVYHFRRFFTLAAKPASFVVHVSGDNRYQLFANCERMASGPARGDLTHWRFESVDLAPHLKAGRPRCGGLERRSLSRHCANFESNWLSSRC